MKEGRTFAIGCYRHLEFGRSVVGGRGREREGRKCPSPSSSFLQFFCSPSSLPSSNFLHLPSFFPPPYFLHHPFLPHLSSPSKVDSKYVYMFTTEFSFTTTFNHLYHIPEHSPLYPFPLPVPTYRTRTWGSS